MYFTLQPWQLYFVILAGWVQRGLSYLRYNRGYLDHYHAERNHQGLKNSIISPGREVGNSEGSIECRERLSGMLKYYYRLAA